MGIYHTILQDRAAIAIGGADRVDFLQNLFTQNIAENTEDMACMMSALLTPQGKLAYDFLIFHRPDIIVLDCDMNIAEAFMKRLAMYKLRAAIEITRLDESPILIWSDEETPLPPTPDFCPDPRHKALGLRGWFATPPALDYPSASPDKWRIHRLRNGVPQGADEMPSGEVFPLEFGLEQMNGIDFSKGCFIGQEVSSRVHRKGQLRKTLWAAQFSGDKPSPHTPITTGVADDMRQCGQVVSVYEYEGCYGGLVLIRNDAVDKPLQAGESVVHKLSGLFDFL